MEYPSGILDESCRVIATREPMWGKLILPNLGLLLYTLVCLSAPNAQSSEALLEQGLRLFAQGRFSAAVALFNQYKQTNPQDARPYFYAGLAMTEAGRLTAAALEVGEAVRLDPQKPEYLILQASVFARLKQS